MRSLRCLCFAVALGLGSWSSCVPASPTPEATQEASPKDEGQSSIDGSAREQVAEASSDGKAEPTLKEPAAQDLRRDSGVPEALPEPAVEPTPEPTPEPRGSEPPADQPCPDGHLRCVGTCVPMGGDNCGACGNACPTGGTTVCETTGTCRGKCVALAWCKQTEISATGRCLPTHCFYHGDRAKEYGRCTLPGGQGISFCEDRAGTKSGGLRHCGTSCTGMGCPSPNSCHQGQCLKQCPSGYTSCDGVCRDLQSQRHNCGACGTACKDSEVCKAGTCIAHTCPSGKTAFRGTCVDLQNDPLHCGALMTPCKEGQVCKSGTCVARACSSGYIFCRGECHPN